MYILIVSLLFFLTAAGNNKPLTHLSYGATRTETGMKKGFIPMRERCALTILPDPFATTNTSCYGDSNGVIIFLNDFIINGTPPFSYDWDDPNTPHNDVFSDDGQFFIDSLPAGNYVLTVTDAEGCTASDSTVIEYPFMFVTTYIDSVGLCTQTGGIQIGLYVGPPGLLNYNWDFASTPFDDDFGSGEYYMGFPPASNDQEDLAEGLEGGTYFLEMTLVYDSMFLEYNCVWRDTFNIFIDSLRLICPSGDANIYAGVPDAATTYQWQVDSLNGFEDVHPDAHHAGTSGPLLFLTDMPSAWYGHQYRCRRSNGMDTTYSEPFKLRFGVCSEVSNYSWAYPSAWNCTVVPDSFTDVFITDQMGIFFTDEVCRSLTLLPGARLHIYPPATLTIDPDP